MAIGRGDRRNHTVRYRWLSVHRAEGSLYWRHRIRPGSCVSNRRRHVVVCTVRRSIVRAGRDRIIGRGRVWARVHGIIWRRVLSRRRHRSLHVRCLRVGEHARSTVPARGVVSARDHASYFRRRKIPETIRILICRHGWGRDVVRNRTIWHHGSGHGHGRVVVGTRRRIKAG